MLELWFIYETKDGQLIKAIAGPFINKEQAIQRSQGYSLVSIDVVLDSLKIWSNHEANPSSTPNT